MARKPSCSAILATRALKTPGTAKGGPVQASRSFRPGDELTCIEYLPLAGLTTTAVVRKKTCMSTATEFTRLKRPSRLYVAATVLLWLFFAFLCLGQLLRRDPSSSDAARLAELEKVSIA